EKEKHRYDFVCMSLCICVKQRERERECVCVCVCVYGGSPADINTNAENRAISSSDRCIEHKFFPNSKTELIKSSQPASAEETGSEGGVKCVPIMSIKQ